MEDMFEQEQDQDEEEDEDLLEQLQDQDEEFLLLEGMDDEEDMVEVMLAAAAMTAVNEHNAIALVLRSHLTRTGILKGPTRCL